MSSEVGGYHFAWVGYAEEDEAKTVRVAARAGREGYLEELKVTWDNGIVACRAREEQKKTEEELRQRVEELERFRKATIGREFRMKELKDRVLELDAQIEGLRSRESSLSPKESVREETISR